MSRAADALGDSIAILATGRLRAIGSPLFLKNRFGAGYSLNVIAAPERMQELRDLVHTNLPGAEIVFGGSQRARLQWPPSGRGCCCRAFVCSLHILASAYNRNGQHRWPHTVCMQPRPLQMKRRRTRTPWMPPRSTAASPQPRPARALQPRPVALGPTPRLPSRLAPWAWPAAV
jgi:hypothetical protein